MQTVKVVLLMLICSCLLAACGLKGPLYLPADEPPSSQADSPDDTGTKKADDDEETKKDKPQIVASNH